MKTRIIPIILMVVGACAGSQSAPQASVSGSLPDIFVSVLADVKAETTIPVLFPSELPRPFSDAKRATVETISAGEYELALDYESGVGDAAFAAKSHAHDSVRELPNVREVKLAGGIVGLFRPVSCGGSCAPANLWWERGGVLYQIQLKLPSTLREKKQLSTIVAVANSSILAGPR